MKKIITSIGMIVFAGALVAGGTGAFFSDTETSTGNVFTAGAIDLQIDSTSHYDGLVCVDNTDDNTNNGVWTLENPNDPKSTARPDLVGDYCGGTWTMKDLSPVGSTFFSFSDLKPGDFGENTISLHVENNDAYMCAVIGNMVDEEVGTCTEPESEDGDVTCTDNAQGELATELHFFTWADNGMGGGVEGDNIWNGTEPMLFSNEEGPASDVLGGVVYPLFTPGGVGPIAALDTQYIGMYWCYGDITIGDHTLACNGATVDNQSQTDSLTADIAFYVEQARNNENFTCGQGLLDIVEPKV